MCDIIADIIVAATSYVELPSCWRDACTLLKSLPQQQIMSSSRLPEEMILYVQNQFFCDSSSGAFIRFKEASADQVFAKSMDFNSRGAFVGADRIIVT